MLINILNDINLKPSIYLAVAKKLAENYGYDPTRLTLSDRPKFKLKYGNIYFGSSSYYDYIMYVYLSSVKLISRESALKHRSRYLKRASKIKGNWKNKPESKNNLSMRILWAA